MKHSFTLLLFCTYILTGTAQNSITLSKAVNQLLQDPQMKHALLGFYIVNDKTGNVVYNVNGATGMTPASAQKIVTAATILELLNERFRYSTVIGYDGNITNKVLEGNLYIKGSGDPTLGSDRFPNTNAQQTLQRITTVLQQNNIQQITGNIILDGTAFTPQSTPSGWTWGDLGNYYGAGTWGINWCENKFDILLQSGNNINDEVTIAAINPKIHTPLLSLLKSGAKGSGDRAYIYLPPFAAQGYINGTIPVGEKNFKISGAIPNPYLVFSDALKDVFKQKNISLNGNIYSSEALITKGLTTPRYSYILDTIYSPTIDSISYWFLQKSINLYGEAFAKTIALSQNKDGSTENGIDIIRAFWEDRGIEKSSLKMIDGSGLSPHNKVTPQALVQVLQYAKKQPWFNSFYKALPTFNNMKMKSGTINSTKAFAGYHTKNGQSYTFSIIINNYDGTHAAILQKMYTLLNAI